jgi:hypothetical protein
LGRVLRRVLPFLLFATVPAVFTYPLCGWLFRCGCVSLWGGAADHCNVHLAQAFHCPWCEHPGLGALGFALLFAALLAGGLTFLLTDYPHFLVTGARERIGLPPGPIGTHAPVLGFTPRE